MVITKQQLYEALLNYFGEYMADDLANNLWIDLGKEDD